MDSIVKLFLVFLLTFEANVNAGKIDNSREQLLTLSNAINEFSLDLFKKTAEKFPGKNIIMSPLSADTGLALISMAAEGGTLAELNNALHLPNAEFTKSAFATMMNSLNSTKDITLNIANKVYVKNGKRFALSPQFKTLATDIFASEIENVDFTESTQAAQTINSWVEEKTNNKIKDLVSASDLDPNTRVVLLNAIYLKANWQNAFDERESYDYEFFITRTSKKKMRIMSRLDYMQFSEIPELQAKMVELPYKNGDLSMVIILPFQIDGLKTVINKIGSGADLTSAFKRLRSTFVHINLPQFKIESSLNLVELLQKVGIRKLFKNGAELGGLLQNDETLHVSDAIQKAIIEVGEKGTVAAVATGYHVVADSAIDYSEMPQSFFVDHPFLFCIKTRENIPIFIGQFTGVEL